MHVSEHVTAYGAPNGGPGILMLHGLGRCRFDLELVGARLSRPAAALDAPSHGGRPLPTPLAFERMAEDSLEQADSLGYSELILLGVSMGAAIALTLATMAPERVLGILIVAPSWLRDGQRPHLRRLQKLGRFMVERGLDPAWRVVCSTPPVSSWTAEDVQAYRTRFAGYDAVAVGSAMTRLPEEDPLIEPATLRSSSIRCRVLSWAGDVIHPTELASELAGVLSAPLVVRDRPAKRAEEATVLAELTETLSAEASGSFRTAPDASSSVHEAELGPGS